MAHALRFRDALHELWLSKSANGYVLHVGEQATEVALLRAGLQQTLRYQGRDVPVWIAVRGDEVHLHLEGEAHTLSFVHALDRLAGAGDAHAGALSHAPMPGSVIHIQVEAGQAVQRGDILLVIESMKMETSISAAMDGVVAQVHVQKGQTFERDALLVTLEPLEASE